jgi:hypothetical protein
MPTEVHMPDICRIIFTCRDLNRTSAFYAALGFDIKKGMSGLVPFCTAKCGSFHLEFWPAPEDVTDPAYHPTRFDLHVKSVCDVAIRLRVAFPKMEINSFERETPCIDLTDPDGRYIILEEELPPHMSKS